MRLQIIQRSQIIVYFNHFLCRVDLTSCPFFVKIRPSISLVSSSSSSLSSLDEYFLAGGLVASATLVGLAFAEGGGGAFLTLP